MYISTFLFFYIVLFGLMLDFVYLYNYITDSVVCAMILKSTKAVNIYAVCNTYKINKRKKKLSRMYVVS